MAVAREAHFAKGFARVVQNLNPRMAFAFAAGLVLLEPFNQWINEDTSSSSSWPPSCRCSRTTC